MVVVKLEIQASEPFDFPSIGPMIEMKSEVLLSDKAAYLQFCESMWNRYHGENK